MVLLRIEPNFYIFGKPGRKFGISGKPRIFFWKFLANPGEKLAFLAKLGENFTFFGKTERKFGIFEKHMRKFGIWLWELEKVCAPCLFFLVTPP